jgi:hypothetical protein
VRENGGSSGQPGTTRSPWRSKPLVLLLVLGAMAAMFAVGVVYRIVRPTAEDRLIRDLPVYPGARDADLPATEPEAWRGYGNGFADAIVLTYRLPRGTSRNDVLRFYGTHMPRSFSRDGPSCWARGDDHVLLVFARAPQPALDVGVSAEGAKCPSG